MSDPDSGEAWGFMDHDLYVASCMLEDGGCVWLACGPTLRRDCVIAFVLRPHCMITFTVGGQRMFRLDCFYVPLHCLSLQRSRERWQEAILVVESVCFLLNFAVGYFREGHFFLLR